MHYIWCAPRRVLSFVVDCFFVSCDAKPWFQSRLFANNKNQRQVKSFRLDARIISSGVLVFNIATHNMGCGGVTWTSAEYWKQLLRFYTCGCAAVKGEQEKEEEDKLCSRWHDMDSTHHANRGLKCNRVSWVEHEKSGRASRAQWRVAL